MYRHKEVREKKESGGDKERYLANGSFKQKGRGRERGQSRQVQCSACISAIKQGDIGLHPTIHCTTRSSRPEWTDQVSGQGEHDELGEKVESAAFTS